MKMLDFWRRAAETRRRLAGEQVKKSLAELQEEVRNGQGSYQLPPAPKRQNVGRQPIVVGFGVFHCGH